MSEPPLTEHIRWSLAELIDYELLLEEDANADLTDQPQVALRNSEIRKEILGSVDESVLSLNTHDSAKARRLWLHRWLRIRLQGFPSTEPSIGEATVSSLGTLALLFAIVGFALGLLSLCGLLAAPGVIQVPLVLLVYLGPQLLFIVIAVLLLARQRITGCVHSPRVFQFFAARLLTPLLCRMTSESGDTLASDSRAVPVRAAIGLILGRGRLHRDALTWPLLSVVQCLALSFSVAVAIGMLVLTQVAHFNFGWASTNSAINAELVHGVCKVMAAPWTLILPEGLGFPTLEQVERSQTFRGQQMSQDFPVLSSWWIFLVMSLFTYACVPRIALLAYSLRRQHCALAREAFQDRRSDKLFRQLSHPSLTHTAEAPSSDPWDDGTGSGPKPIPITDEEECFAVAESCFLLTELELSTSEQAAVRARLAQKLGFVVSTFLRAYTPDDQEAALGMLKTTEWTDKIPRVVLLYRASDPIVANFRYFCKACLKAIGEDGHLIVALGGRQSLLSEAADEEEVGVWREYMDTHKISYPNAELEVLTDQS